MGKRTLSLKKFMITFWTAISGLLLVLFVFYGMNSMWRYRDNFLASNKIVAETYAHQLNKDIHSMQAHMTNMYTADVHFQTLWRSNITQMQWIRSTYYLANSLDGKTSHMDYYGGVFFYDGVEDSLRSSYSEYEFSGDEYRLNMTLKEQLRKLKDKTRYKGFFQYEGETYLLWLTGVNSRVLGFVINLNRYFDPVEDQQVIVYEKDNLLLASMGTQILSDETIVELISSDNNIAKQNSINYIVAVESIDAMDIDIAVIRLSSELKVWNNWEFWLLVILIPSISVVGFWMLYRLLNRVLLLPVNHLLGRIMEMKNKKEQNKSLEIVEDRITEFGVINRKLDDLLIELERLGQEKYKQEMDAKEAQLQYYQLQVDPHFYLNCLNILDSLLDDNNIGNTKMMINALSRHFRFVFQDGQKLVTVQEEIEELQSYCNIYSIKGGIPILFQVDAGEDVLGFQLPILCIQTFLENSIKYASIVGRILSINVSIETFSIEGSRFVRILVSDNGKGYPQEKLDELNQLVKDISYGSKHVGINNIKYRLFLIYGEKAKLSFYNNPTGGAVTEILLPEEKTNEHFGY